MEKQQESQQPQQTLEQQKQQAPSSQPTQQPQQPDIPEEEFNLVPPGVEVRAHDSNLRDVRQAEKEEREDRIKTHVGEQHAHQEADAVKKGMKNFDSKVIGEE